MERKILHVDMNNCYASIEVKRNPQWRGKPLAVCGSPEDRHGIILAKSQEAKALGIKTGQAIWQALEKCPDLLLVPPHYEDYLYHSRLARKIYSEYTDQVESFGLDECWLDVTGSQRIFGPGEDLAHTIRQRVKRELGITVSVGVSFNKIFAKLGSDLKKPDAVTCIPEKDFRKIVWPLPVEDLLWVGRATKRKLNLSSVYTIGDLAHQDPKSLRVKLGINGLKLWTFANGLDTAPVAHMNARPPIKTIGHSITTREDLETNQEVFHVFQDLAFDVSRRLREEGLEAGGVEVWVRDTDLLSRTYQKRLGFSCQSSILLAKNGQALFEEKYPWHKPIRALGIRAIYLTVEGTCQQLNLFNNYGHIEKRENLDRALYSIKKRYGRQSISFASLMGDIKIPKVRNEIVTLPGGMR